MASTTKAAQADHVQHAARRVDKHAGLMRTSIDGGNLKEALKHALAMLHELRTKHLSPKPYYELYMTVFSQLDSLEAYFHHTASSGKRTARELYEMVQHAGNVLPRLYLMVTAGPLVIRSRRMPANKVLKDMCEMCRGVQHPTRGLFLRYFLLQKTGTLLPEEGSPYHGEGGTVEDAVMFVLENAVEMIRLWVRMQAAADGKSRKRRSRERLEIRQVIGTAIDKLANVEGVTEALYSEKVLPALLTEIGNSGDALAQEFIFDCLLQAFPVTFHLATLEPLVAAAASVVDDVSVRDLMTGILRRISTEAGAAAGSGADVLDALLVATREALAGRGARIGGAAVADIFGAIVGFAASAYPGDLGKVDVVLKQCAETVFEGREANAAGQDAVALLICKVWEPRDGESQPSATGAVSAAGAAAGSASLRDRSAGAGAAGLDAKQAALLPGTAGLLACLGHEQRRRVAASLADALATQRCEISTVTECDAILRTLSPLLRDEDDAPAPTSADSATFAAEQRNIARVVHCIGRGAPTLADQYAVVCAARKAFGFGRTHRIVYTLQPVVVRLLEIYADGVEADRARAAVGKSAPAAPAAAAAAASGAGVDDDDAKDEDEEAVDGDDDDDEEEEADAGEDDKVQNEAAAAADGGSKKGGKKNGKKGGSKKGGSKKGGSKKGGKAAAAAASAPEAAPAAAAATPAPAPGSIPAKTVLRTAHETCAALSSAHPHAALRLFLLCASATRDTRFCYNFLTEALVLHEEVPESALQRSSLLATIGTIRACSPQGMGEEGYTTLATRSTKFAAKLLRKAHAVECVLACARLFWAVPQPDATDARPGFQRAPETLKCLTKALDLADDAIPRDPAAFVDILASYVYFLGLGCPTVKPDLVMNMVTVAKERISEAMTDTDEASAHLGSIVDHINFCREQAASVPAYAAWASVKL